MSPYLWLLGFAVVVAAAAGLRHYHGWWWRQHDNNRWHEEQIEHFLHCADDPEYSFKGFEWADYASNADVEVKKKESPVTASVGQYLNHYWPARFEPPFVRLRCPDCLDEWDVWINEDGEPEDKRDLKCTDCDEFGELIPE